MENMLTLANPHHSSQGECYNAHNFNGMTNFFLNWLVLPPCTMAE